MTDSTIAAYVDPPPVEPPAVGSLLVSARNVVVGSDYDAGNRVNRNDESPSASGPIMPLAETVAPNDVERPGASAPVLWIRGFAFRPQICNGGGRINPDGTVVTTATGPVDAVTVRPYLVEGFDKRSTFGAPNDNERAEARYWAHQQLLACEGKQIEAELWTGLLTDGSASTNRHLTSSDVSLIEGDRLVGHVSALAALEREIRVQTCGGPAMIHCRADTASYWVAEHLVRRVGNLLLTEQGTIVVVGAGYTGSAPDTGTLTLDPNHAGAVPSTDSAWAYATSIVDVRRGDFITSQPIRERVDTSTNLITTYERRPAASAWGCLHLGIHVDHINRISTTGS